ncbi:MAG: sulfotransferase domain-containing protein [Desulfovibrio sp.]
MSKIDFAMVENVARNLVFVDGLTRCGKSLFTSIVPSFERMEHTKVMVLLEQIIPAVALGRMDLDFARALLRLQLNEEVYNTLISRNVNFRLNDTSGVHHYWNPRLYYDRLNKPDGDGVVEELRRGERMFPVRTHDFMVNLDVLDGLELDFRMLEMLRDPVALAYSWWKQQWGERFGHDPRAFTLCLESNGQVVPWYCHGQEREWQAMNPMERCIHTSLDLTARAVAQYRKASEEVRARILVCTFEDYIRDPQTQTARICDFLGTVPTSYTEVYIKRDVRPWQLDPALRAKKVAAFKNGVSGEIFKKLMESAGEYEAGVYGIQG